MIAPAGAVADDDGEGVGAQAELNHQHFAKFEAALEIVGAAKQRGEPMVGDEIAAAVVAALKNSGRSLATSSESIETQAKIAAQEIAVTWQTFMPEIGLRDRVAGRPELFVRAAFVPGAAEGFRALDIGARSCDGAAQPNTTRPRSAV